jgi:hypothetical protein
MAFWTGTIYPTNAVDWHELEKLRWKICVDGGWIENGIADLEQAVNDAPTNQQSGVCKTLVFALGESGRTTEAIRRLQELIARKGISDSDAQFLAQQISLGKWKADHDE